MKSLRLLPLDSWVRGLFVAVYAGIIIVCFMTPIGPRVFWTIALPLLIISIILMGFNTWRRLCPLAFWGTFGVRLKPRKAKPRRVPEWMERWFFVISLLFLIVMLVVRLLLINGDGPLLGITLILIGALAAIINFYYSGRTWCNFVCPVGVVERIYTDPNSLRTTANSQCAKCTACKRHCPDIDHENAYWKDVSLPSRRIAFYSFPGVVLGFYSYYFLRAGTWEAYFDGRWTRKPFSLDLAFGPGFFFAPRVPALVAAIITLLGFAALSYLLFSGIEKIVAHWNPEDERRRHLTLALASFSALNIFYLFAGAPTLRLIPGATRLVAFLIPLVSGVLLYQRWRRQSEDYAKVKSARHLLPLWKFKTPPPRDPAEVFAFFQGQEEAHTAQVSAYEELVREMLAAKSVTQRELNLLAQMRRDLNISETEHRKILAALSEEERNLFDPERATTVERRLQLQGYQSALATLLTRRASADELALLRQEYGIEPEVHEAILKELRGESSLIMARIQNQVGRAIRLRQIINIFSSEPEPSMRIEFALDVLGKSHERYQTQLLEALRPLGDVPYQTELTRMLSDDSAVRAAALENIQRVIKPELAAQLHTIFEEYAPVKGEVGPAQVGEALQALSSSHDVYHRATAALLLDEKLTAPSETLLRRCLADEDTLVSETAIQIIGRSKRKLDQAILEKLLEDSDVRVREGAKAMAAQLNQDRSAEAGFLTLCTFEKMLFLQQVPLFTDLDIEDLHELSQLAQEITLEAPAVVVEQGEISDELYIVTKGRAEVSTSHGEKRQIVAVSEPGSVIGEMAVIDGQPRSATVQAITPELRLLRIGGETFRHVLANRADLSMQVMRIISLRLRKTMESV